MNNLLKSVFELPDVSFIDNDTLQAMMERLVNNYEKRYEELTGKAVSLGAADPMRIALYAVALDLFQTEQYVDRAGKQDLLKYSYGEFLDNLAGNRGVTRNQPTAAKTTVRFTLSETKGYAISIPAGTKVTNGNGIYFQTSEYAEIPAGSDHADVSTVCTVNGIQGNDLLPGQVDILVNPLPYIKEVANITTSEGGAELESDESLAERTYLSPSSYSVAGPDDAYVYWARTYNTNIGSVKPTSPIPGEAVIYILMRDGSMPGVEMLNGLEQYLAQSKIRPMTDLVSVKAPTAVSLELNLTYYINQSDLSSAITIQQETEKAISEYIEWQTTVIGRDINPDELRKRIKAAGAKRAEIISPVFTVVGDEAVAQLTSKSVTYGGLEDD